MGIMKGKEKSPLNRREDKETKQAFAKTKRTVKPVAKDTNKTRRDFKKPSNKNP